MIQNKIIKYFTLLNFLTQSKNSKFLERSKMNKRNRSNLADTIDQGEMCVCMCVCEREREREEGRDSDSKRERYFVCVCVCVCERERERERESGTAVIRMRDVLCE